MFSTENEEEYTWSLIRLLIHPKKLKRYEDFGISNKIFKSFNRINAKYWLKNIFSDIWTVSRIYLLFYDKTFLTVLKHLLYWKEIHDNKQLLKECNLKMQKII